MATKVARAKAKVVLSRYFLPTLLKQLFLSPSWPLSQQPIRARGIIVKYTAWEIYLFDAKLRFCCLQVIFQVPLRIRPRNWNY